MVMALFQDLITLTGSGLKSAKLVNGIDLTPMKYVLQPLQWRTNLDIYTGHKEMRNESCG